jgi:hypothetical protein
MIFQNRSTPLLLVALFLAAPAAAAVPTKAMPPSAPGSTAAAAAARPENVHAQEVWRARPPTRNLVVHAAWSSASPPVAPRAGVGFKNGRFDNQGADAKSWVATGKATPASAAPKEAIRPRPILGPLDRPLPVNVARQKLNAVENTVRTLAAQEKHPVVIFDIDDTLVRVPGPAHPDGAAVAGAASYVKTLVQAGAQVVYLSGRGEDERGSTVDILRRFGLPLDSHEKLVLNPTNAPTVEYKAAALHEIVKLGQPVAAFDNEKENARMFRRELPQSDVSVFRLDTDSHRGDPGGTGPVYVIKNFKPAAEAP